MIPTVWTPTPRQHEFLAAPEDEVLYGGAAGGGKTDALIMDALGWDAYTKAEYRALILRRTYPELKEVVDRTRAIYPVICPTAQFNSQGSEWRFPSGARIEFGYLDRDSDVQRYQSRQFQWIGWEELAQWSSPHAYEYMISRLRAPDRLDVPVYVRATCNPDGPGAKWIADRFGIGPEGDATFTRTTYGDRTWSRRFIPSRLHDNPYLTNSGYRERLMMLPDQTRRALLDGRWDEPIVGGAIYTDQLQAARNEGRITRVPVEPTVRVDTWWDLGMRDAMCIWFTQDVGREIRVVDYYECTGEGFPHYAAVLDKKGYLYGRHTAPADIAVRELGTGRSRIEAARDLGIKFETAPSLGLEDGIHATRMLFPKLWFDETRCKAGLDALSHYRRDYNSRLGEYKSSPVHDWSSHGADALRTLGVAHKIARPKTPPALRVTTLTGSQGWLGA